MKLLRLLSGITLVVLSSWLESLSQATTFVKFYDIAATANSANFIMNDTSSYLFSFTSKTGNYSWTYYMTRIDLNGNVIWQKVLHKPSEPYLLSKIIPLANGNYVAMLNLADSVNFTYNGIKLVWFDSSGDSLYSASYNMFISGNRFYGTGIVETHDGGFAIVCPVENELSQYSVVRLVRIDNQGMVLFTKDYFIGSTSSVYDPSDIIQSASGNLILYGKLRYVSGDEDQFIIVTDSLGNEISKKGFWFYPGSAAFDATHAVDGNIYLTGWNDGGPTLAKSTPSGNIIWQKKHNVQNHYRLSNTIVITNGDLVLTGYTQPFSTSINGLLVRTDSTANKIWERIYSPPHPVRGPGRIRLHSIARTSGNGFICAGVISFAGSLDSDGIVIKLDSLGCLVPGCATGITDPTKSINSGISVYPNPFTGDFTFSFHDLEGNQEGILKIIDMSGKTLLTRSIHNLSSIQLNGNEFPTGLIMVQFISDQKVYSTRIIRN